MRGREARPQGVRSADFGRGNPTRRRSEERRGGMVGPVIRHFGSYIVNSVVLWEAINERDVAQNEVGEEIDALDREIEVIWVVQFAV